MKLYSKGDNFKLYYEPVNGQLSIFDIMEGGNE